MLGRKVHWAINRIQYCACASKLQHGHPLKYTFNTQLPHFSSLHPTCSDINSRPHGDLQLEACIRLPLYINYKAIGY